MRVLVADDHAQVRWALRTLIHEMAGIELVGEVAQATALIAQVQRLRPDLLLLEWELAGGQPQALLAELLSLGLPLRTVVLSGHPESRAAALSAGAAAWISKADPPEQVLRGLCEVMQHAEETRSEREVLGDSTTAAPGGTCDREAAG
jgi:DNA-binding NarL/FixJ family response regulator